ncbi:hypothetical protein SAMN04489806_1719 [Paramicrobacterium humi]|uniref:Lipoprotein n=1 Tax=Paramicrobacterium humi TaxID=640635 RepID=A0A1H4M147_9MICO|nr:hypothetical protein [Microbacterium humi]SEB76527.1 hypothetical protein SAMN04489806_1719 [Microbacterium humi]
MSLTLIRRMLVAGVLASATLAATACAPDEPKPTSTPTSTAIFASEDDALQAAIDVYQKFNAAYDAISASGVADYSSVKGYVTSDYYAELESDKSFEDEGLHTAGESTFDSTSVVSLEQNAHAAMVRVKLCQDVRNIKVIDNDGNDVTSQERDDRFPYEVLLHWDAKSKQLRIADAGSWQETDFCD